MEHKNVTIKITAVEHFISFLDGSQITKVNFIDGKTLRQKQFRSYREFQPGEKIKAEKIGSGKYAGFDF